MPFIIPRRRIIGEVKPITPKENLLTATAHKLLTLTAFKPGETPNTRTAKCASLSPKTGSITLLILLNYRYAIHQRTQSLEPPKQHKNPLSKGWRRTYYSTYRRIKIIDG